MAKVKRKHCRMPRDLSFVLEPSFTYVMRKFCRKVKRRKSGCWEFQNLSSNGYGSFRTHGAQFYAHRIALVFNTRQNLMDKFACHKCHNPSCVRPSHLYWGEQSENMRDKIPAGRSTGIWCQGENQSKATLTDAEARKLYIEYANSKTYQKVLAARHNVKISVIADLVRRRSYKVALADLPVIPYRRRPRIS